MAGSSGAKWGTRGIVTLGVLFWGGLEALCLVEGTWSDHVRIFLEKPRWVVVTWGPLTVLFLVGSSSTPSIWLKSIWPMDQKNVPNGEITVNMTVTMILTFRNRLFRWQIAKHAVEHDERSFQPCLPRHKPHFFSKANQQSIFISSWTFLTSSISSFWDSFLVGAILVPRGGWKVPLHLNVFLERPLPCASNWRIPRIPRRETAADRAMEVWGSGIYGKIYPPWK